MPTAHPASPSTALRILLRSIGQIVLQANAFTGVMLIAALALTDLRLAGAALVGAAVANLTAALSGAAHCHVEQGRHGFNGALAALAAVSFAPAPLAALALAPSAALGAALVQRALRTPLAKWRQCPYSAPYIAATALWMPLVAVQHPIDAATSA
ncbi:urea transporter, partial [Burkholderia vietnamiensis]